MYTAQTQLTGNKVTRRSLLVCTVKLQEEQHENGHLVLSHSRISPHRAGGGEVSMSNRPTHIIAHDNPCMHAPAAQAELRKLVPLTHTRYLYAIGNPDTCT